MSDQAFFDRKIRTLFSRFDVDGSGFINEKDFDQWAEKLIAYGKQIKMFTFLVLKPILLINIFKVT
jgi:Ca2+-binding EF-hand superfamily protein